MAFEVVRSKKLVATVKHYGKVFSQPLGQVIIALDALQGEGKEVERFYPLQKVDPLYQH